MLVAASAIGVLPTPGAPASAAADERASVSGAADDERASARTGAGGAWGGAGRWLGMDGVLDQLTKRSVTPSPPRGSGRGRRVVFDERRQHVWLVDGRDRVQRDYPVSGSVFDNLDPGRYEVYSRSRHATSFDLSSTMEYMVRFTQGERAAIGFHSIPVGPAGRRLQTFAELGTPRSHGCIRQRRTDARALWRFADLGARVVVV